MQQETLRIYAEVQTRVIKALIEKYNLPEDEAFKLARETYSKEMEIENQKLDRHA